MDHNKLWKILKDTGITDNLTCLMRNLYAGQEATVRTGHRTRDCFQIGKVQFSHSVISISLRPQGQQHARLPCPSPTPGACFNSCPSMPPTISSSLIPFSSCLQSFPASWSFLMSQFFASGGQSIGVSALASVLPMNIQH